MEQQFCVAKYEEENKKNYVSQGVSILNKYVVFNIYYNKNQGISIYLFFSPFTCWTYYFHEIIRYFSVDRRSMSWLHDCKVY
jgi:hypothetical protein